MIKVYERLNKENVDAKLILQVHDEIMLEVKDEDIDKVMDGSLSNTQLYKMAGNSIVVNCLKEIFSKFDKL